jgi:dihydrofolate reductase
VSGGARRLGNRWVRASGIVFVHVTKVIADITMSLDGYVTAPDAGPGQGLGRNGLPLHDWAIGKSSEVDRAVLQRATRRTGAVVMGRRTFDVVDAPTGWNDEIAYGAGERPSQLPPVFVVTHHAPSEVRLQRLFTFVTTGVRDAIDRARSAAGERDVVVMGGGQVVGQAVRDGLVDELVLHLSPILLGGGTPLWEPDGVIRRWKQHDVIVSLLAIHVTYVLG